MELYQLRSFVTVAQLGNLTRAAEKMHVSQPAVSSQIKALEAILDVDLFDRGATGLSLTRAGQALLPCAERVLAAAQELKSQAIALKGKVAGKVRIGTVVDPDFLRLSDFLSGMLQEYPLIEIELRQGISGDVMNSVRQGELDAGFYLGEITFQNIASIPLRTLYYRIVAPIEWRDRVENASFAEIATLPWIWTPQQSLHYKLASKLFQEHGLEPTKVIEADNASVIKNLVTAAVGVCLMREDLAESAQTAGELIVWPHVRLEAELSFIYDRDREPEPVMQVLTEVLRNTWNP